MSPADSLGNLAVFSKVYFAVVAFLFIATSAMVIYKRRKQEKTTGYILFGVGFFIVISLLFGLFAVFTITPAYNLQ